MIVYKIFRTRLARLFISLILLLSPCFTQAQTEVKSPLIGSPTAGSYYSYNSIILNPDFSFIATDGNSLDLYIADPDCQPLTMALSANQNYIYSSTPRIAGYNPAANTYSTCDLMQTVQYIDGLGRPLQTIQVKGTTLGKDMVQPFVYDALGREAQKYLPYAAQGTADGSYKSTGLTDQGVFYSTPPVGVSSISLPSASTIFEASPLSRPLEQGAPGQSWQLSTSNLPGSGHTVKTVYENNVAGEVILWTANTTGTGATGNTNYDANQLYKKTTADENGNKAIEYKDKKGRIICKKLQSDATTFLITYYVYNALNNLSYVIPPIPTSTTYPTSFTETDAVFTNFVYGYHYDDRNRLSQKKIPGKDWEFMVYDKIDKLVASQDGNQRLNNQWMITKYDALGRAVMTGSWSNGNTAISPQSLTALVYAQNINWENKDNTQGYGYSMTNTYPHTMDNVLTVNYYDNYSTPYTSPYTYSVNSQISPAMPAAASTMTTGLLTMSLTAVLNGVNNNTNPGNMLGTVYYYDDLGRDIQSYEMHYLGGKSINAGNYDQISHSYNFTNDITQTVRIHHNATNSASPAVITIANSYVYDHMGRKRQTFEQINGDNNVLLSQNDYNEIGQKLNKHLHSVDNGASFLQNISYAYNERGWLSTLNTDGNLLNFSLNYNNSGTGITPQWNGNISQMGYNVNKGTNTGAHQFIYNYDGLNRLTQAQSTGSLLDESLSYDRMGNISNLTRGGTSAVSLAYTYTDANGNYSNRLQKVTNNNVAFRSYGYDANGNATSDGGTQTINYNLLNLPQSVLQGGTTKATYIYNAAGNKLKNTGSDGSWDYVNGIVYQNGVISFIQTEEGRANYNVQNSTYNYEYNLKDHLGNTRVSFDKDPSAGTARIIQEDEYYSFGLRKIGGYDFANNNRYLYNGKELQTDLANQYDYGSRFYDPLIGRFSMIDPYSEFFPWMTNYQYASNGPSSKIDLDGLEGIFFFEETAITPEAVPFGDPVANLAKAGGELNGAPISESVTKFEWHHLIPQVLRGTIDLVKEAIREGFGFDKEENLSLQEKFGKATGKGVHGNHPKYTEAIKGQLKESAKNNPGSSALDIVRGVANNARQTIINNPGVKINDLFNLYFLVPSKTRIPNVIPGKVFSGPIPSDPEPAPKEKPKPEPQS
ncbi:DUF6443 domain-containing protein [Pedobacter cryoconitis]|uniref:RHS repeat-associated protein n=1 Tax=Pedobacter cryoconitis TaxID=188932 RepID=A0A7X0MJ97_9SPHI|nr:DUF6443 domain-containing protein [Pedobacter cryoconitis]MBB6500929.1 RHS repeat-associated protein [Pedobacter cryoconitis]